MLGAPSSRILVRHVFPNAFPLIFANTILTVAVSILSESVLAFLGLRPPDTYSWGRIIAEAIENAAVLYNAWWLIVPGLCIVFLVFGFYLFGYALDEILNPWLPTRSAGPPAGRGPLERLHDAGRHGPRGSGRVAC